MHGIIMMKVVEVTISVAQNDKVVNNGVMVSFEKYSFTNNGYFYTEEWLRRCNPNNIEIREDQSYNFLKDILLYQKIIVALTKTARLIAQDVNFNWAGLVEHLPAGEHPTTGAIQGNRPGDLHLLEDNSQGSKLSPLILDYYKKNSL